MEKNAEEHVYQQLKNAIIKRYIRQGSKLVETTLARQLKVSRTPVRGGIKRLVYDGLATYVPNKGACVIEPTISEIEQAFFVRLQLEKAAAALAAANISASQLEMLKAAIEKEAKIFEARDLEQYYVINDAIHMAIARASGNQVLSHYINELLGRTKIYLILFDPFDTMPFNPSIHEHRQVLQALEKKNPDLAEAAMEAHLKSALEGMDVHPVIPEDYLTL